MMKAKYIKLSILGFFSCAVLSWGQGGNSDSSGLNNPDPDVRMRAFYAFRHKPASESRSSNLIGLLRFEHSFAESQTTLSEDYVTYYGDLIASVAELKDVRALPDLVKVIDSGQMAISAVAAFGPQVIDSVIARTTEEDS